MNEFKRKLLWFFTPKEVKEHLFHLNMTISRQKREIKSKTADLNDLTRKNTAYVISTVEKVNAALGIELTDWQIYFIFFDIPIPQEQRCKRGNGKTLAAQLKLCLTPGPALEIYKCVPGQPEDKKILFADDADISTYRRRDYYIDSLQRVYEKLHEFGGIYLRKIKVKYR